MRWKIETLSERIERMERWTRFFCWKPRVIDGHRVWFESVETRVTFDPYWKSPAGLAAHPDMWLYNAKREWRLAPQKAKKKPENKEDRSAREFAERYARFR
jgi:hypothetical protein